MTNNGITYKRKTTFSSISKFWLILLIINEIQQTYAK